MNLFVIKLRAKPRLGYKEDKNHTSRYFLQPRDKCATLHNHGARCLEMGQGHIIVISNPMF